MWYQCGQAIIWSLINYLLMMIIVKCYWFIFIVIQVQIIDGK